MPENNQFNSLGETTKNINIALKYTNGDIEKARKMVTGQWNDVVVTKGRFSVGNHTFGIFLFFYNKENRYIMNINSLLSKSKSLHDKISINDNWKFFYSKFKDFVNLESPPENDSVSSYEFTRHLIDSLKGYEIYDYIAESNLELSTDALIEIIAKLFNREEVNCQIEFEQTSSLVLELSQIPVEEPPSSKEQADGTGISAEEKLMAKIESEAMHVIDGRVIVAPVKGKYIKDIQQGDKIKVLFTNEEDSIAAKVASAQKAITDEGEMLPVKARIKAKIPLKEGGFMLYGVVAKNILARIVEEENVKIEMDVPQQTPTNEKTNSPLLLYVAFGSGILLIILVLIILLMKT